MTALSKYGHVDLSTLTSNFKNVGLVWKWRLVQLKRERFEVPESRIKLVCKRDLKISEPKKFETFWLFCLPSIVIAALPVWSQSNLKSHYH